MTEPDFFERTEIRLRAGMRRGAHLPWHTRIGRRRFARPLAALIAVLVVATPAVAAATNWFGIGTPNRVPKQSPTQNAGRAFASTSVLLSLRVPDPQGGPPWGMRIVQTTRGATCVQIGRVEDGQVGTLGIDGVWNNDRLFHPYPKIAEGNGFQCGTTDGAGHAFFDSSYMGMSSSAMAWDGAPQRLVYMGLLGPDARSVTYLMPSGKQAVERTSGSDGAYLFVFARNDRTCKLYAQNPNRMVQNPDCEGISGGEAVGSPITSVTYSNGEVCKPGLWAAARTSFDRFARSEQVKLHIGRWIDMSPTQHSEFDQAETRFLASRHTTLALFNLESVDRCPDVGYIAPREKHLTRAMVEAPIHIQVQRQSKWGIPVRISFTARQPVTSGSSWYESLLTGPCEGESVGQIGFGNIRAGQTVHDTHTLSPGGQHTSCKGVYHGIISYMQNSGPIGAVGEGTQEMPGQDGSIIVNRFSFTIR